MKKIVYYVATSVNGYISGTNEDISLFIQQGESINKYFEDLKSYKTVIMGRKTYEFGYKYGLPKGQPAYSSMKNYVFSESLNLDNCHSDLVIQQATFDNIMTLKSTSETDIYLCGGGEFAGWLFDNELIDIIKLKLNPIVLNEGVSLFESIKKSKRMKLIDNQTFSDGMLILTYELSQSD